MYVGEVQWLRIKRKRNTRSFKKRTNTINYLVKQSFTPSSSHISYIYASSLQPLLFSSSSLSLSLILHYLHLLPSTITSIFLHLPHFYLTLHSYLYKQPYSYLYFILLELDQNACPLDPRKRPSGKYFNSLVYITK